MNRLSKLLCQIMLEFSRSMMKTTTGFDLVFGKLVHC